MLNYICCSTSANLCISLCLTIKRILQGSVIQERQSKTKVPIKADTALEQAKFADQLQNDVGTGLMPQLSTSSNMPFKEQQLKQLRAQCLVFLAFRHANLSYV